MIDIETQQRFVALRAEGWSFARIAAELNISKPTLINWSRKFQFDIHNQRAINIEALQEKWLASQDARVIRFRLFQMPAFLIFRVSAFAF